jgi:hypothetical protein
MPVSQSKKFLFILFLVVTFLWIGYQAVLVPTLQRRHAEALFAQAVAALRRRRGPGKRGPDKTGSMRDQFA